MKYASLVISIVALIGVTVLFGKGNSGPEQVVQESPKTAEESALKVAFVNVDSIVGQYEYMKVMSRELLDEKQQASSTYQREVANFKEEFEKANQQAQYMTTEQRMALQTEFQSKESSLVAREQQLNQLLMESEKKKNELAQTKIREVMSDYAEANDYKMILASGTLGAVLHGDSLYDVTSPVLKMLNERYAAEKTK